MYGILGEDQSDVNTLKVIIRRLAKSDALPVRGKGCDGCSLLLKRGAAQLRALADLGCRKFIVCYDADGPHPDHRREEVLSRVIRPSDITLPCCVVIPVQELEAWILADIEAVTHVFSAWRPQAIDHPENVARPKEHLEHLSRSTNRKPRYDHATHNERVAKYLRLEIVHRKCPSFRPLHDFVVGR